MEFFVCTIKFLIIVINSFINLDPFYIFNHIFFSIIYFNIIYWFITSSRYGAFYFFSKFLFFIVPDKYKNNNMFYFFYVSFLLLIFTIFFAIKIISIDFIFLLNNIIIFFLVISWFLLLLAFIYSTVNIIKKPKDKINFIAIFKYIFSEIHVFSLQFYFYEAITYLFIKLKITFLKNRVDLIVSLWISIFIYVNWWFFKNTFFVYANDDPVESITGSSTTESVFSTGTSTKAKTKLLDTDKVELGTTKIKKDNNQVGSEIPSFKNKKSYDEVNVEKNIQNNKTNKSKVESTSFEKNDQQTKAKTELPNKQPFTIRQIETDINNITKLSRESDLVLSAKINLLLMDNPGMTMKNAILQPSYFLDSYGLDKASLERATKLGYIQKEVDFSVGRQQTIKESLKPFDIRPGESTTTYIKRITIYNQSWNSMGGDIESIKATLNEKAKQLAVREKALFEREEWLNQQREILSEESNERKKSPKKKENKYNEDGSDNR